MLINRLLYISLLFLNVFLVQGQGSFISGDLIFEQINTGWTTDLAIDREGRLWATSDGGVHILDGYDHNIVKDYLDDTTGYRGGWSTSIHADSNGNIWVGTKKRGLNVYRRDLGKFVNLSDSPSEEIVSIVESGDSLVVGYKRYLVIVRDDKVEGRYPLAIGENDELVKLMVMDGKLGILSSQVFGWWDGALNVALEGTGFQDCIRQDRSLLVLSSNELIHFDWENGRARPVQLSGFDDGDDLQKLYARKTGGFVLGVEDGVYFAELSDYAMKSVGRYETPLDRGVSSMIEDGSGNLYIGVWGGGTMKLSWNSNQYAFIPIPDSEKDVLVYHADDQGRYWIGTSEGIYRYNSHTGEFIPFGNGQLAALDHLLIASLMEDNNGDIWAGTWDGLCRFNSDTQQFECYGSGMGFYKSLAHHLIPDDHDNIWYGTPSGLAVLRPNKEVEFFPELVRSDQEYISSTALIRDNDDPDVLWISYEFTGLFKVSIENGQPANTEIQVTEVSEFFGNKLQQDTVGRVWLTTNTGLFLIDKRSGGVVEHFHENNMLLSDRMFDIIPDPQGNFWLKQDRNGAILMSPYTYEILSYSPRWLKNQEGELVSPSHITEEGKIFTNGKGGFYTFYPDSITSNPTVPVLVLEQIVQGNTPMLVQRLHGYRGSEIQLPHDQNMLEVSFKAIQLDNPSLNRYRYRLNGSTDQWVETGTQRTIRFAGLAPGAYELEVMASNSDQIWSDPIVLVRISILPPVWQTSWAYLAYGLILLVLGVVFYRIQLNKKLALNEANRLRDVDDFKNRFYTNITHEFRTPLTVILGLAQKIESDSGRLIRRNGRQLLTLINQLLELGKIESSTAKLQYEQGDIVMFLNYATESFMSTAFDRRINLSYYSEQKDVLMDFDRNKLLLVVNNLLSNALKFTPEYGRIMVTSKVEGKHLRLEVRDTGVGISEDKISRIFDRYYQVEDKSDRHEGTGIGLALTKELVELMGGTIGVTSTPEEGTTFLVVLPIARNAPLMDFTELSVSENFEIAEEELEAVQSNRNQVLVIEDNRDVSYYIESVLRTKYDVMKARNGRIGVEMAIEHIPDLIITDVMMPEKDGLQVCQEVKNDYRTSHIPIIMLTAKADIESRLSGLRQGADAYLAKPFNEEELLVRLENLIQLHEKLVQRYSSGIPEQPGDQNRLEDEFVIRIRDILLERLSDDAFGIEELCRETGISRTQLHRKLTALTGKSTSIFIREIRLAEAFKLLQSPGKNISEIAYHVGFSDPNYFTRLFTEKYGKSPSDTRKG